MDVKDTKNLRKKKLRTLNVGVGIDTREETGSSLNKKIIFEDGFVASDDRLDDVLNADKNCVDSADSKSDENVEDAEDVEEVSASTAKEQVKVLLAAEKKTRREEFAISNKKKRKSKGKAFSKSHEMKSEDDIDDSLLDMIDSEHIQEALIDREKKIHALNKRGRHTTFVSKNDPSLVESTKIPSVERHGIEVLVLPGNSLDQDGMDEKLINMQTHDGCSRSLMHNLGTEPSKSALLYCRGSQLTTNSRSDKRKNNIKRSKKMKFAFARGRPIERFVTRKSK